MEDFFSATDSSRAGFDDGTYADEVMNGLDTGFNDICNMIFDPKEELLPPVSLPKSVEHQLPYYAPSQGEANIIPQHSPQQGAPEQDNQLRQLELTCNQLTAQVREATVQLNALRQTRVQPSPPSPVSGFNSMDFQEALKGIGDLSAMERKVPIPAIPNPKLPVGKPRTAHNLIEKKYRLSINEKINELRLMVAPDDEGSRKLQKAAVLKKAIDYIRHLQMKNVQLFEHNKLLQKQINFLHHKVASAPSGTPSPKTPDTGIDSPVSLDGEMQTYGATHSGAKPVSQPKPTNNRGLMSSISDSARLFSCLLLVVCLSFNPFQSASFSSSNGEHHYGRSLLQDEAIESGVPAFYLFILWTVRLLIASVSLGGLMVWSRLRIPPQSGSAFTFWRHEKQASLDLNEGNFLQAQHKLELCLMSIGRPFPASAIWLVLGLLWNMFCHFLHSIYIGRWLVAIGSVLWRSKDDQLQGKGGVTCEDIAKVYHRLHQIKLGETGLYNHLLGAYYGLNALNMHQISGQSDKGPSPSDLYMMMVLQLVKLSMVTVKPLMFYYLQCSKSADNSDKLTSIMRWAWHSEGRRFLVNGGWVQDLMREHEQGRAAQPLMVITKSFCKNLLVESFRNLLLPNKGLEVESTLQLPSQDASLRGFRYVLDLSREINLYHSTPGKRDDIESIQWWSSIGIISVYWLAGNDTAAADYYSIADSLPESLNKANDPLPSAVLLAFKAIRMHVSNGKSTMLSECMRLCQTAGGLLKQSVALPLTTEETIDDELMKLGQLHVCDWLLGLQQILWENCECDNPIKGTIRSNFQRDVESLSYLASRLPESKKRLYLYKAVESIMQGGNPLHIQQLLQQTIDKTAQTLELSSYEHAMAVLLSHKHLPASFDQGNSDLQSAARVLNNVGPQANVKDCQQIVANT
ncbi:sterol regulatory element-binding protein 1-like isoform X2 [Dysidea avara]|uniref:sterol regulatory element-binding protein 1-like isoform X2 n=1 Tax=Dysidea avara TaxID=196820 RepID=UPI00332F07A7